MSSFTDHENELSRARRYEPYAHFYDAAFQADPNPEDRKFDSMAPIDAKQWDRLETFRGNDKDAYSVFKADPENPSNRASDKEQGMWKANEAAHWQINWAPSSQEHDLSKNKWLPPMNHASPEQIKGYFEGVHAKYGSAYDAYAKKEGNNAVHRDDYMRTMAVVEMENMKAARQQSQHVEQPEQVQTGQTEQSQAQPEQGQETQERKRTRISLKDFQGSGSEYIAERKEEISVLADGELDNVMTEAKAQHKELFKVELEQAAERVPALNKLNDDLQATRAQHRANVASEVESQQQTRPRQQ